MLYVNGLSENKVDNANFALVISIISVALSMLSLGWNIYRDVVLKARVAVSFALKNIIQANAGPSPTYIGIRATNHGPGSVNLSSISLVQTSFWKTLFRKKKYAVLHHDHRNPFSGQLPCKLEVGETVDFFVDYDSDCFLKNDFTKLGIGDSFRRTH